MHRRFLREFKGSDVAKDSKKHLAAIGKSHRSRLPTDIKDASDYYLEKGKYKLTPDQKKKRAEELTKAGAGRISAPKWPGE